MTESKRSLCIVLPYRPVYSETFLRAQIERLPATISYLNRFPVEGAAPCAWTELRHADTKMIENRAKTFLHRFLLNPAKKPYLRHFFKSNQIEVVLAEYGMTGARVMSTCERLGLPLVVHFHGYDAYSRKVIDRYEKMYRQMFAYASAIVAVSKHMVNRLVDLGAPVEKVVYNPYGVDIGKFKPVSLASQPQVLAVARFVEKKAPYLTILAFKKVLERLPEARLVMAGDGRLLDVCRQISRSLHIEYAVTFIGAVDHDQVVRLMQESRLFVQHSLVATSGDSEGTPVGILEAGASGLPVVSTAHAGIVDAVIHGKTGFLVDEGDIDGMSEYIHQLLSDPELSVEMGKEARNHIGRNYDVERSIKNLQAIIDKCVEARVESGERSVERLSALNS